MARDAFNGTLLWKIPVPNWGWQTWRDSLRTRYRGMDWIKTVGLRTSTLGDYVRRMVADAERLYFTLGRLGADSREGDGVGFGQALHCRPA